MKINYTIHGLVSSLLLNLGLTRLAEKFDPMLQLNGQILSDSKSSAFSEYPCAFAKSSAFSEFPCAFAKSSAFSEFPCAFAKSSAFSEYPCAFTPASAN